MKSGDAIASSDRKARAFFFIMLMFLWMFSGAVAFAGGAAAITGPGSSASADDVLVGQSSTTQDVSFDLTVEDSDSSEVVTVDLTAAVSAGVTPSDNTVALSGTGSENVSVSNQGLSSGVHTIDLNDATTGDGTHDVTVTVTYSHYTIDVTSISNVEIPVDVSNGGSDTATFDLTGSTSTDPVADGDITYDAPGSLVFQGQDVYIHGPEINSDEDYELRSAEAFDAGVVDDSTFVNELDVETGNDFPTARDSSEFSFSGGDAVIELDSADLDASNYYVVDGDGDLVSDGSLVRAGTFEVGVQDLSGTFDEEDLPAINDDYDDSTVKLDLDSNRGTYSINVSADGALDNKELFSIFGISSVFDSSEPNNVGNDVQGNIIKIETNGTITYYDADGNERRSKLLFDVIEDNNLVDDYSVTANSGNEFGIDPVGDDNRFGEFNVQLFNSSDKGANRKILLRDIRDQETAVSGIGINQAEYDIHFDVYDTQASTSSTLSVFTTVDQSNLTYTFEIPNDGEMYSLGIPGETEGTLADIVDPTAEGYTIFRFVDGEWTPVTDFESTTLNALDAIAIATEGASGQPDTFSLEVELATQSATTVPPQASLTEGWNFVAAPQRGDADTVLAVQHSFLVLDRFNQPSSEYLRGVGKFNTHYIGSDSQTVSPFKGYYVYAEDDTTLPGVLTGVETRTDVDEQLNLDTFSNPQNTQDELAEAQARINELEDQNAELENEVSGLEGDVSALESENADLESEIDDLEAELRQCRAEGS